MPTTPFRSLLARSRLLPFEWVSYLSALGTLVFLRWRGLAFGWNTVLYTFPNLPGALPGLLVQGFLMRAFAGVLVRSSPTDYLRRVASWPWLALWLRLWLASAAQFYTYMWLKVSIPLLRAEIYDFELWRLDRWLHLGVSPTILAIELVAGTWMAPWIDRFYGWWLPSVAWAVTYVFAATGAGARRHFAFATAVLWIGGAWLYLAVPALGPCFSTPDVLEPIREAMPSATGAQAALWSHYLGLLRSRGSVLASFSPLLGVAAMPSLHVAAYAMLAFWARRHARRWLWPTIVATVLIFFGSLATGWHYAVDGYVGVALAWAAVRLADRFEPVACPEKADSRPAESPLASAGGEKQLSSEPTER